MTDTTETKMADSADQTQLLADIQKQMEFYFSNSNLPNDKFLKNLYDSDPEHFIDLSIIENFKRMRQLLNQTDSFTQSVTEAGHQLLVKACQQSTFLKLNEALNAVTRAEPLPDTIDTKAQTVHLEGVPVEEATIEKIGAFVAEKLASTDAVKAVRIRRVLPEGAEPDADKIPDGSAFVELSTTEQAEQFVALAPLQWGEKEIKVQLLTTFLASREKDGKKSEVGTKRKARDQPERKSKEEIEAEKAAAEAAEVEAEESRPHVANLLIKFDTVNTEVSSRESLKDFVQTTGAVVAYTDYSKGESSAVVRLAEDSPVKADAAVAKLLTSGEDNGPLKLDEIVPVIRALADDEERVYWRAVWAQQRSKKNERSSQRGGRGGRGGRGRGRGGRGGGGRGRDNKRQRRDD